MKKVIKKIFFVVGDAGFFCEWGHMWMTFRATTPAFLPKSLDGNISLCFLLEATLQSKSFDTIDHLLGFWVQKLWYKAIKIFDQLAI